MLVPLDWLEEWIEIPVELPVLAERFTMAGLEVDSIERTGPDLSPIAVGEVMSCERHPDADRLSVCEVDVGLEDRLVQCDDNEWLSHTIFLFFHLTSSK